MLSSRGNHQMDLCTIRKALIDGNISLLHEFINDKAVLNKFVNGDPRVFYEILLSAIIVNRRKLTLDNVDEIYDDIVLRLIKAAKEVHFGFFDAKTLLMVALENCMSYKIIDELIEAGSDVNVASKGDNVTPLMYALHHRNEKNIIAELITRGADINYRDNDGCTPLFYGVRDHYDRPGVIELLLRAGSNIHDLDNKGRNVLMFLGCNCFKRIDCFKQNCFDCNYSKQINCKVKESIDLLHKFGIDDIGLKHTDFEGNTILHETRCSYVFELAIRSGVSIEARNNEGRTPLLENVRWKPEYYAEKLVYLLKCGANIHSTDKELQTVLHLCYLSPEKLIFGSTPEMLIYHGANMYARNIYNQTPLDIIIERDHFHDRSDTVIPEHIILFDDDEFSFEKEVLEKLCSGGVLSSYIAACKKQLKLMRETFIADGVTFYEFCILKRYYKSKLVNISHNEYKYGRSEIYRLFPIYRNVIISRIKDNRLKKGELDLRKRFEKITMRSVDSMKNDFSVDLNYDCLYCISKYLNYGEMFNIFSAATENEF